MYARTSTWAGSPEALEAWSEHVRTAVAPMVAALADNAGAYFFLAEDGRHAMTLTLWSSLEAAAASDAAAERSRAATVAATGVELVDRGRFEVLTPLAGTVPER
jgi:hypothetical protein